MDYQIEDQSGDRKYFTVVPNYIINHSSVTDQGLYLYMKRKAGERGVCFVTQTTMCKDLQIGKDKLTASLTYLLKHGWIELVGKTPSKTKPINTYKVTDIWDLNIKHYQDKKKSPKSAQSSFEEKDKFQIRPKISSKTAHIRRTNIKEEPINNQQEANASGFKVYTKKKIEAIGDVLKNFSAPVKKPFGASYAWQDTAVRWWKKLGLNGKPTAGWFKLFKLNVDLAERSCSWVSDSGGNDLEHLTYWAFNKFKKEGKITYEKHN
jgi:hypothetical protein